MDAKLYPTPTRLALLADVAAGHVTRYPASGGDPQHARNNVTGRIVTAVMDAMEAAGWIELRPPVTEYPRTEPRPYLLTAAGTAIHCAEREAGR